MVCFARGLFYGIDGINGTNGIDGNFPIKR